MIRGSSRHWGMIRSYPSGHLPLPGNLFFLKKLLKIEMDPTDRLSLSPLPGNFFFLKKFWWRHAYLWDHWYPWFGLHLWCNTFAGVYGQSLPHMRVSAEVGYWTGLQGQTSHSEIRRADHSATATRLFPWELIEQIIPWKILSYQPIRASASFRHHTCR